MEPYKDTFSKIKFRGSFGLTGNDQLDGRRFAYQTTLGEDGTGYDWGTNGQYYHRNSRFEGDMGNRIENKCRFRIGPLEYDRLPSGLFL